MRLLKVLQLALVLMCLSAFGHAQEPEYWSYWDLSNEANVAVIDHAQWDQIVSSYAQLDQTSGIVSFSYGKLSKDDIKSIEGYVSAMEKIDPREYSKLEQQAYWMNLYNALTVLAVHERYQALSQSGFQQSLPAEAWDENRVKVARKKLSLNDISHKILRPIFKDHRILFGLNCATLDCPNLADRAYTSITIRQQLKDAGFRYINNNTGVRYTDGVLHASRLFGEYLVDFAPDEKTLTKVLAHYAEDMKALYVLGYTGGIVYERDSRLNIR